MANQGKFSAGLLLLVALAGCTSSSGSDPSPSATSTPSAVECPSGLGNELGSYLVDSTHETPIVLSVEYEVSGIEEALGTPAFEWLCVLEISSERESNQRVGVTSSTAGEVLSGLNSASWQVDPIDPSLFVREGDDARLHAFSVAETDPVFGFAEWGNYFDKSSVILVVNAAE